jgi:TonB family protein
MRMRFAYLCSLLIHGLVLSMMLWWPLAQTLPSWTPQHDNRICLEMEAELAARTQSGEESGPEVVVESPRSPDAFAETAEAPPADERVAVPQLPRRTVPEITIADWSQRGDQTERYSALESSSRGTSPVRETPPLPVSAPSRQAARPTQGDILGGVSAATALDQPALAGSKVGGSPRKKSTVIAVRNQPALAGSKVDELPQLHPTNPKPPYPLEALEEGREGVVTLWATIAADGSVSAVRVYQSSGVPALDASALETVQQKWRFTPARRGNTPVAQDVILPIRFSIRGR